MSIEIEGSEYLDLDDALEIMGIGPLEYNESMLKSQIIGEILKAQSEKGITQQQLEELSGVKQPQITRIINARALKIMTVLKILKPLGMTLAIVPDKSIEYPAPAHKR